ncbi:hypothetical protein SAMN05192553_103373 [Cyclobacterium xiamenense]|uniref:Uncharacterized protein n=1 Tax=Cyclobacterium xiamenense TaxID=1297121 RepID=A0A1H6Y6E4_9BACT|nr:hypothetical protein SAMN05192553_103373 [Cyclobacterium xiamenense]
MIVQGTRLPTFDELIAVLKCRFPNHSVYLFDSKPQKSIIVRKSALVGAQITLRENEMIVDACCPNIFISALIGLISTIFPPYLEFEMKVTDFLKNKYNPCQF